MANVLSCFFPTTLVLVDDDPTFLADMSVILRSWNVTLRKFLDPYEALDYINGICTLNKLDCFDLIREGEGTSDWKSILFNINKLHQQIYNIDRFCQISTVIADHSMCGMNGVKLCSLIDDKNIQKILLTGFADEKAAINAFNGGHINRFIKKEADDLEGEINDSVKRSINRYFDSYSGDLARHLSIYDKTHLKDPIFANFFFNTCLSNDFIEYYMLDGFGSYIFLTAQGQSNLLSVLTEHESEKIVKIGIESGEIATSVLEILQSREYMLVSHNRNGQLPPISEWEKHIMPARRLEGYQTYYFALTDHKPLDIDFENIKSFESFQKVIQL
jgi:CheY-like chemotaxis protein